MRAVPHKHCNGHHKATGDDDNPKIPAKESARKKCGSQTSGTAEGRWQQHKTETSGMGLMFNQSIMLHVQLYSFKFFVPLTCYKSSTTALLHCTSQQLLT